MASCRAAAFSSRRSSTRNRSRWSGRHRFSRAGLLVEAELRQRRLEVDDVVAADLLAHATDEELDNFIPNHNCRVEECGGTLFSPRDLESV